MAKALNQILLVYPITWRGTISCLATVCSLLSVSIHCKCIKFAIHEYLVGEVKLCSCNACRAAADPGYARVLLACQWLHEEEQYRKQAELTSYCRSANVNHKCQTSWERWMMPDGDSGMRSLAWLALQQHQQRLHSIDSLHCYKNASVL